ncbi:MAG TPA: tannase/feruloyl esterase family alpha/beta hydrolase [Dongiaceae bacterium]|nr:tannase/feruloyl esterase family alpha/beta hydrolase [Dongiaceae bacterium]
MFKSLPSFCRVALQLTPSADSDIRAEVWLPSGKWNGRLQVVGNGGFAGEINYSGLAAALLAGYAAASTDTGHAASGVEAGWALGHPEKVTDFGWRAIHVTTLAAKEVIRARYGNSPKYSYFFGCSNGGRQALMEAQRFPEDFNGILAGAPANYWTHLVSAGLWNMQALTNDPASYIPSAKLPALAQAVNAACDALDGTKDGVVDDPRRCHFQPEKMLCTQDGNGCLTAPQITALEKLYEGPHTVKSGRIFPGFLPGAEEGPGGWGLWITGPQPGKSLIAAFTYGYFANMVYEKADWSYNAANVDDAVKLADEKTGKTLNATDANLAPFRAHGGKLILYHGWNDPAISALNTIDYWQSVRGKLGGKETDSFARLYMLPGVQHCSGGPGLDEFGLPGEPGPSDAKHNVQAALELWVEKGTAPDSLIVSKTPQPSSSAGNGDAAAGKAKMTRPLCPYPQEAKYKGTGDPNEAASFTCSAP